MGKISRKSTRGQEYELTVEAGFDWDGPLEIGESIAVSGVCLTVTKVVSQRAFTAFASAETIGRTTLGQAEKVNLERALALGARLGGHLVSGHVDGPGTVMSIERVGSSLLYRFSLERELAPFIIPKGSIAIDGVSLTVNEVSDLSFTVNLIPHTAKITTFGLLKPGHQVNLEMDLIGKYVHRLMTLAPPAEAPEGLSLEFLAKNGYY